MIGARITYRARNGQAHESTHEYAVAEVVEKCRAFRIQRKQVLDELVSLEMPIEIRSDRPLHDIECRVEGARGGRGGREGGARCDEKR